MKIKIMDLLVLTKTRSFVLSYPVPFQVSALCFTSSSHVPIFLFHSQSCTLPQNETEMRSTQRNGDNLGNSGKSGLEPKLPKCCVVRQIGPLPRSQTQGGNPDSRIAIKGNRVLYGLKMLLLSCFQSVYSPRRWTSQGVEEKLTLRERTCPGHTVNLREEGAGSLAFLTECIIHLQKPIHPFTPWTLFTPRSN